MKSDDDDDTDEVLPRSKFTTAGEIRLEKMIICSYLITEISLSRQSFRPRIHSVKMFIYSTVFLDFKTKIFNIRPESLWKFFQAKQGGEN